MGLLVHMFVCSHVHLIVCWFTLGASFVSQGDGRGQHSERAVRYRRRRTAQSKHTQSGLGFPQRGNNGVSCPLQCALLLAIPCLLTPAKLHYMLPRVRRTMYRLVCSVVNTVLKTGSFCFVLGIR